MRILITNDDGINGYGLFLLANHLKKYGEVIIVAPDTEKSASSHSIILRNNISFKKTNVIAGFEAYEISGTPVDCVRLAVSILGDFDIVFSGINNGLNIGTDIIYSGTVAAAREGYIEGIPSVAISTDYQNFECVEKSLDELLNYIINNKIYSKDYVLNVNYPVKNASIKGYKFCKMGKKRFKTKFEKRDNNMYAPISNDIAYDTNQNTDVYLADRGYITFVPLFVDMTNEEALNILRNQKYLKA